jgi:hypothetical protein
MITHSTNLTGPANAFGMRGVGAKLQSVAAAVLVQGACLIFPVVLRAEANPDIFHEPFRIEMDGKPFDTDSGRGHSGHAGPCVFDVNGDGLDDLVVGGYSGTFRILLNRGTAGKPHYTDESLLEAGGIPAKVRIYCCIAAQPRFCDLDGDGLQDMLANSYDPGHCHFFKGQPDGGFAAEAELMDISGSPIRSNPRQEQKNLSFASFFAPVDWDDDGDLDLLIGCGDGGLKARLNIGTVQKFLFAADNIVVADAAGDPLLIPDRHCCPTVADWDGDGRWDIISGGMTGGVWWFRNVGDRGAPRFAAAEYLIDPPSVPYSLSIRPGPGQRTQPEVADYDGDGRLDLIVGDYRCEYVCKPNLSPEELRSCEKLFTSFTTACQAYERKSKQLEGKSPPPDNAAAWERLRKALDASAEQIEFNRAKTAFEEYIRPRLRQRHVSTVLLEDGSTEQQESLFLARGNVWVYLRR